MKMILAAILAGTFLVSLPVRADDKPADEKGEKSDKSKKDKKKKEEKEGAKSGGGGW